MQLDPQHWFCSCCFFFFSDHAQDILMAVIYPHFAPAKTNVSASIIRWKQLGSEESVWQNNVFG